MNGSILVQILTQILIAVIAVVASYWFLGLIGAPAILIQVVVGIIGLLCLIKILTIMGVLS